jgi:hypothetical protein
MGVAAASFATAEWSPILPAANSQISTPFHFKGVSISLNPTPAIMSNVCVELGVNMLSRSSVRLESAD